MRQIAHSNFWEMNLFALGAPSYNILRKECAKVGEAIWIRFTIGDKELIGRVKKKFLVI